MKLGKTKFKKTQKRFIGNVKFRQISIKQGSLFQLNYCPFVGNNCILLLSKIKLIIFDLGYCVRRCLSLFIRNLLCYILGVPNTRAHSEPYQTSLMNS